MMRREGLSRVEALVVVAVVGITGLLLLYRLPRGNEDARFTVCRQRLYLVGLGLARFDEVTGQLPAVGPLAEDGPARPGPLALLLEQLGTSDFEGLDASSASSGTPAKAPGGPRRIAGLLCPTDPATRDRIEPAPTSYRACTGGAADGAGGAFGVATPMSLAAIEAADGKSYTAAMSERLISPGDPQAWTAALARYRVCPAGVFPCEDAATPDSDWLHDAGHDWSIASWQSSLYNHVIPPGAVPSCVADDESQAHMGASSAHPDGVNVLRCDLSVATFKTSVAPEIWRELATVGGTPPAAEVEAAGLPTPLPAAASETRTDSD